MATELQQMTPEQHDGDIKTECEQFGGRKRAICRGEADLPLHGPNSINAYRVHWGLPPLESLPDRPCPDTPPPAAVALPPLIQQVVTFAGALTDHIRNGLAKCDEEQIEVRLQICRECPSFTGSHCRECGCGCSKEKKFFNKLAWRSEKCPLGHW